MASFIPAFSSYDTALCVIPPAHLVADIDRLRGLYDKAFGKWPAHINLIYPFVAVESLPQALAVIRTTLSTVNPSRRPDRVSVRLNQSDYFAHRRSCTVFVTESGVDKDIQSTALSELRDTLWRAFGKPNDNYRLHLTIGQSDTQDDSLRQYLLDKAALLPPVEWLVEELVVLVRERQVRPNSQSNRMVDWGSISLSHDFPISMWNPGASSSSASVDRTRPPLLINSKDAGDVNNAQIISIPGKTYQFSNTTQRWEPFDVSNFTDEEGQTESSFTISTYNVLTDSPYPPPKDRFEILARTITADDAVADVLVLQEVSDDFLSFLLNQNDLQTRYPFTSHGPSTQDSIGPLASLRNIVILSRLSFSWEWLPFEKKHKGTMVAKFPAAGKLIETGILPLVLAGVHLTCGLSDSSVAAKHSQLKTVLKYLSTEYTDNQWIVAGDFNIPTSSYTVDAALEKEAITPQTAEILLSLETLITESGLCDAWFAARMQTVTRPSGNHHRVDTEIDYEGEEGATFDPIINPLAANISTRSYHCRPQRYDRVLARAEGLRQVLAYNLFGFPDETKRQGEMNSSGCGSDHWGVRASLQLDVETEDTHHSDESSSQSVEMAHVKGHLLDVACLKSCLESYEMFPSEDDINHRRDVFSLVKAILQQSGPSNAIERPKSSVAFVVVPVGSYRLGVWSASSDIDCLCIGPISPRVFFAIATNRLRRAANMGVRILRKVKAASGTMLELEVQGVKFDLQYCAAAGVVER
jgi:endonuclease/exonuclease/phosphatase family metal-dependent hydrolase/2'-5' RNA ligase